MWSLTQEAYKAAQALSERLASAPDLKSLFVAYGTNREAFQRRDQYGQPIWTPFLSILSPAQRETYQVLMKAVCVEFGVEAGDEGCVGAAALDLVIGNPVGVHGK